MNPNILMSKIDFNKEYGLIGILAIMGLYLISLFNNYLLLLIGITLGNNNTILTAKYYLEVLFGPLHYLFFIVLVLAIVLVWKKHKYYWIAPILLFLTKMALMLRVQSGTGIIWTFKGHFTGSGLAEHFIIPMIMYILFIAYLLVKRFGKYDKNLEQISAILSFFYVVFVWF